MLLPDFLPLPHTFDLTSDRSWSELRVAIQDWMATEGQCGSESWSWALELFWIAYIAASPTFPGGTWPVWDVSVPLKGAFIGQWLSRLYVLEGSAEDSFEDRVRRAMWASFRAAVEAQFPRMAILQSR